MKKIGTKSVFWLLVTSVTAIVVTLVVGAVTNIGKGAGAVFADISSVTDATLSAYQEMETSFDTHSSESGSKQYRSRSCSR